MTYSVITKRQHPDSPRDFVHRQLDRIGLAHSTFSEPAVELIIRSADGVSRKGKPVAQTLFVVEKSA